MIGIVQHLRLATCHQGLSQHGGSRQHYAAVAAVQDLLEFMYGYVGRKGYNYTLQASAEAEARLRASPSIS